MIGKDYRLLKNNSSEEKLSDFIFSFMIRIFGIILPIASAVNNKRKEKITVIVDINNTNMMEFLKKDFKMFLRVFFGTLRLNFPSILIKVLVINAPMLFKPFWEIAKLFINKHTARRVSVHIGAPLKVLNIHIHEEHIPQIYGGKCIDEILHNPGPW